MGYRTWCHLEIKDHEGMTREEAARAFMKIIDKAEPCMLDLGKCEGGADYADFDDNNNNTMEAIAKESRKYPGLLMEGSVDGASEDSDDQRKVRIRNGKTETVMADITYGPFTELLTEKEKSRGTRNLNRIELIGHVGMCTTQTIEKTTCAKFSVATNYAYTSKDGCAVIETMWHNITAWEGPETPDLEKITKGTPVHVTGRLRLVKYIDHTGIERNMTEVVAHSVEVLHLPGNGIQPEKTEKDNH